MNRIKKGDTVKIVSGNYKGQSGRIIKMLHSKNLNVSKFKPFGV